MNALRLEELEHRDLLNAYMAPPSRPSVGSHTSPTYGVERSPTSTDAGASGRADHGGPMTTSPGDLSLPRINDGGTVVVVELVEIVVIDIRPQVTPNPSPTQNGDRANYSDPATVVADPTPRPVDHAPAVNQEPATDASARVVTPAATRAVTPTTTPFALAPQANPAVAAVGPVVAQLPLVTGRTADGMAMAVPVPAATLNTPAGGALPTAETAEPPLAQPEQPQAAPVLTPLAAIDVAALGRGLGQFLHQIEKVGEELVGDGDGLRPWLVAGAAAATACEIARRQLKRAAEYAPIPVHDPRSDRPYVG
jgi:hypothetical protein